MRITQRGVAETSLQGLNRNLSALGKLQQQMTSGRLISTPSDSPTGTNRAMQVRQDLAAALQHARNISDGQSWLDTTDSALLSMASQVRKVRDLTVQGMNTGTVSPASQQAIRAEVEELRKSLLGVANQTVSGRAIFGGVSSEPRAYDADGGYVGAPGSATTPLAAIMRRVSDAEQIRIDITAPEAFGDQAEGDDLFAVVAAIATNVTDDPAALAGNLEALDVALDRLLGAAADIGARSARMEKAGEVNASLQLALTTQLDEVEGIDLPKTIMQLQMQETGYQAALSATARVLQPSLLDFLR